MQVRTCLTLAYFLLSFALVPLKAQNAYQDALFFAKLDIQQIDQLLALQAILNLNPTEVDKLKELKKFLNDPFSDDLKIENLDTKIIAELWRELDSYLQMGNNFNGVGITSTTANNLPSPTTIDNVLQTISGASWQTMVIDATATIIAEQFKEGITIHYVNEFKNKMGEIYEVRKMIPITYDELNRSDPFQYDDLGTTLKAAFQKDLKNLPFNFRALIKDAEEPIVYANLKTEPVFQYFDYSIELIDQIVKGQHPAEILNHLDFIYYKDNATTGVGEKGINTLYRITHLVSLLEKNLRTPNAIIEKQTNNIWINFNQLRELRHANEQKYFLALLYHQDKVFFNTLFQAYDASYQSNFSKDKFNAFLKQVEDYLGLLNLIEDKIVALKNTSNSDELNVHDYVVYLETFLELFEKGADLFYCQKDLDNNFCTTLAEFSFYADAAKKMYQSILEKNYQGTISEISTLLSKFSQQLVTDADINNAITTNSDLRKELIKTIKTYTNLSLNDTQLNPIILAAVKGDANSLISYLKTNHTTAFNQLDSKEYLQLSQIFKNFSERILLVANKGKLFTVMNAFSKYTSFMIDITSASSSAEVKAVIQKSIVPPHNYAAKRYSKRTISLSAHPGLFIGYEALRNLTESEINDPAINEQKWQYNFGFTSPIGLEITFGRRESKLSKNGKLSLRKKNKEYKATTFKGGSFGLFASILDLGAVVNYRLSNNSDTNLPQEITFKQVFSPGAYLNFGCRNSPLTIGAGVQYTPELRKIGNGLDKNALRFSIRCSWDIPLLLFSVR